MNGVKTQQLQVFVAGFEPIGQCGQVAHGGQIAVQVTGQTGAQVDVHADGPTHCFGRLHDGQHFVVFGRHGHERAGVQHAWGLCFQQGHHLFNAVIAISNTLAVKTITGLTLVDMHHSQSGWQGAVGQQGLCASLLQALLQGLPKGVA